MTNNNKNIFLRSKDVVFEIKPKLLIYDRSYFLVLWVYVCKKYIFDLLWL